MDIEQLKNWLEGQLRTKLPDELWDQLIHDTYAKPSLSEVELQDLIFEANKLMRMFRAGAALGGGRRLPGREKLPESPDSREIAVNLRDDEAERARVFARLAAQMAAEHPDVVSFRENVLDEGLLTDEQAGEFVAQQGGLNGDAPILTALRQLGKRLSRHYRWRDLDAVWFVLTGHTPPVFPLYAIGSQNSSIYGPATAAITLVVDPWVSAKEVAKTYKDLQAQMLGKGNNRPISAHRLKLVEFVEEHRPETSGWRSLRDRWNKEYPDHQYSDVRNFSQAYKETYVRLMYPAYNSPNWRPYTPTPAQSYRDNIASDKPNPCSRGRRVQDCQSR